MKAIYTHEELMERRRAQKKRWRDANKEKIRKYNAEYDKLNPDKAKDRQERYRKNNKESVKAKNLKQYNSRKHSPLVYLIPNENYVGYTCQVKTRMYAHKANGKDISNYRILKHCNSKEEALELEALLHSIGYKGKN